MSKVELFFPLEDEDSLKNLKANQFVYISGQIYTARDQAHYRMIKLLEQNEKLPIELKGNLIYYCGPTPPKDDGLFGSAGPTTSSRMDDAFLYLVKYGLKATLGKGERKKEVIEACRNYCAVYFVTFGGLGAYLAKKILYQEIVAFEDLGAEAMYKLKVDKIPAIVAIDCQGKSIF
jgi:fumarate hydratase subunit beta